MVVALVMSAVGVWYALRKVLVDRRPGPPLVAADWNYAATELGLVTVGAPDGLEGSIGEVKVEVRLERRVVLDEERQELRVEVTAPNPTLLTIEPQLPSSLLEGQPHLFHLPTGDDELDRAVRVQGSRVAAAATLDHQTRLALRKLVPWGLSVRQGKIEGFLPCPGSAESLVLTLRSLADTAERLAQPPDLVPLLVRNSREDPLPAIRSGCLGLLAHGFADRPETRDALRRGLDDPDPGVRLVAACSLGGEGRPTLVALAAEQGLPLELAVRAADALGRVLPVDLAERVLARATGSGDRESALAAVRMLGRLDAPGATSRLARLSRASDFEIALEATRVLGERRDSASEEALASALGHWSAAVREAAVDGLGTVGTVASIPVLRALLAAHPLDRGLRRPVEAAIGEIHSRATGAAPGQLSLAGGQEGQLTLTDGEPGKLSLATDQEIAAVKPDDADEERQG